MRGEANRFRRNVKQHFLYLVAAFSSGVSIPVLAAETPDPGSASTGPAAKVPTDTAVSELDEILVTARRVQERLQTVPIQITALSGDQLRASNVQKNDDLKFLTPSLNVTGSAIGGGSAFVDFSLRGVTRGLNVDVVVQPYLNEMPVSTIGLNYMFYDMESIQVLEGPQGVAFGKNSTGGAILYESKRPEDTFSAFAEGTVGSFSHREVTAMVNVPLGETVSTRIAGNYQKRDGFLDNVIGKDLFDRDHWSLRGTLSWHPNDRFSNDLIVDHYWQDEGPGGGPPLGSGTAGGAKALRMTLPPAGYCQGSPPFPEGVPSVVSAFLFAAARPCFFSSRDAAGTDTGLIPMTPEQLAIYGPLEYHVGSGLPGAGPSTPFGDLWYINGVLGPILSDRGKTALNPVPSTPGHATGVTNLTRFEVGETPLGNVSLKNIFGYRNSYVENDSAQMPIFLTESTVGGPLRNRPYTEEFQVFGDVGNGNLSWLVGAFYTHESRTQSAFTYPEPGLFPVGNGAQTIPIEQLNFLYDVTGGAASQVTRFDVAEQTLESHAFYGRAIYKIFSAFESTPSWLSNTRLTAGYRMTYDKVKSELDSPLIRYVSGNVQSGPLFRPGETTPRQTTGCNFFLPDGTPISDAPASEFVGPCTRGGTQKWSEPNWEFGIDDQITDQVMVYAKRSHGYKAGGANAFSISGSLFYDPEFVTTNEVGFKSDWRVGTVFFRVNGTAYWSDYSDVQLGLLTINPANGQVQNATNNDSNATVNGWNLSAEVVPFSGLRLRGAYAHFDNHYDVLRLSFPASPDSPYECSTTPFLNCKNVPFSGPRNTLTLQGSYTLPLGENIGQITANVDYFHQGKNVTINPSTAVNDVQPAYEVFNGSIVWQDVLAKKGLDAVFWVKNIEDKRAGYFMPGVDIPFFYTDATIYRLEPRSLGLTLRYAIE